MTKNKKSIAIVVTKVTAMVMLGANYAEDAAALAALADMQSEFSNVKGEAEIYSMANPMEQIF